jgi:hypothetical protein
MNFWDQNNDNPSEWELMQNQIEVEPAPIIKYDEISSEKAQEIQEQAAFELDSHETEVVYNTRLRLKQAELYEMLINANIFEGVDSDQQAIENVKKELKAFVLMRLEILMGIKQEPKAPVVTNENIEIELPFNDIEIDFLKQLALKGTAGKSALGQKVKANNAGIKPITKSMPKKQELKPISTKKAESITKQVIKQNQPKKKMAPARKAITRPVNEEESNARDKIKSNTLHPRKLTQQEIETLAKEEIKKEAKSFHDMSRKEKQAKIEEVKKKYVRPVRGKEPIPTTDQLEAMHTMNQSRDQNHLNSLVSNIIANKNK